MLRVLSELLWSLRRDGLSISTSQALAAAEAVELVGFSDRSRLVVALEGTLVTRAADRARFRAAFDDFFRENRGHAGDLFDRLRGRGFTSSEISFVRDLLEGVATRSGQFGDAVSLRTLAGTSYDLDWLLRAGRIRRTLASMTSPLTAGYFAERSARELGLGRAAAAIDRLSKVLVEGLGEERGALLAASLREELDAVKRRVREVVERIPQEREQRRANAPRGPLDVPFASLSTEEAREVQRAVRTLSEKLRGGARVRTRRGRRGRIDGRRTTRAAMRTFGVPVRLYFKRPRIEKPKIIVLCDVSDSVRQASRFMLEFVAMTASLFESTRSFVFVGDLVETTDIFRAGASQRALGALASGSVVDLASTSHYERAFLAAERAFAGSLDRRTTVVVLGDGRTNHRPDGAEALLRLKDRARAVVWICPEAPSQWGLGDSRMNRYREVCTTVLSARTARELEEAARRLVRLS